jgi:hypothetical protein
MLIVLVVDATAASGWLHLQSAEKGAVRLSNWRSQHKQIITPLSQTSSTRRSGVCQAIESRMATRHDNTQGVQPKRAGSAIATAAGHDSVKHNCPPHEYPHMVVHLWSSNDGTPNAASFWSTIAATRRDVT